MIMTNRHLVYCSYMIYLFALSGICSGHVEGYEGRKPIAQAM